MIHNSDGMSKKCNSKSFFFFIFSPGFAPYFRMSDCIILFPTVDAVKQTAVASVINSYCYSSFLYLFLERPHERSNNGSRRDRPGGGSCKQTPIASWENQQTA